MCFEALIHFGKSTTSLKPIVTVPNSPRDFKDLVEIVDFNLVCLYLKSRCMLHVVIFRNSDMFEEGIFLLILPHLRQLTVYSPLTGLHVELSPPHTAQRSYLTPESSLLSQPTDWKCKQTTKEKDIYIVATI